LRSTMTLPAALLLATLAAPVGADGLEVAAEGATLSGLPLRLAVTVPGEEAGPPVEVTIEVGGRAVHRQALPPGEASLTLEEVRLPSGRHQVAVIAAGQEARIQVRAVPGWLSLIPPLLAIGLALAFRDVLVSLYLGVFSGALILAHGNPVTAFTSSVDRFIRTALADPDHASIVVFTLLLGGMVGVVVKSGGTQGVVDRLATYATSQKRGQVATWLMGMAIFFDDYANTLVVGPTMRPIADRLRISREKLAYIVDSTAAPIASLMPISTWIGFELGLLRDALAQIELEVSAFSVFIGSIPYRFYPIFALLLVLAVALSGRDAGPMLRAERRAHSTGQVVAPGDTPLADPAAAGLAPPEEVTPRARNAALPILTVIAVTVGGLYVTGVGEADPELAGIERLREVFGAADSYTALLWASLAGVVVALLCGALQPGLALRQSMSGLVEGFKTMVMAVVVLVLAWSLGQVTADLQTADYVVGLTEGVLSPRLVPALVFLIAAAIAFATGTSWATMAILTPLVVPLIHRLALGAGLAPGSETYMVLLLGTVSSVLAGSVWGDHCSPISDTTILSSLATGCDLIAHVRTQLPYAVGLGILGILLGDLPAAFGLSPWISLAAGAVAIVLVVRFWFRPVANSRHSVTGSREPSLASGQSRSQ
jgi:Na+/H+ antiporter NhaC